MAERRVEQEYTQKVREILARVGDFATAEALAAAAPLGINEDRARSMVEWIQRAERKRKPTKDLRPRAVGWDEFEKQAQADEERPWAFKPYFPRALLAIVAGEQKSGKTLWMSWATGQMLRAAERVLFVQLDTARTVLRQRLAPFLPADKSGLRILFRDRDEVSTDAGVDRLLAEARAFGATCIIIDSLFRAMPGMDENDTKDIRIVTTNLERLGTESDAAVVVLHHVRKAGQDGREDIVSADVRGGGGLLSSAAVVILIQKRKAEGEGEARFNVTCGDTWFEPFKPMRCCVTFGDAEPMQVTEDDGISAADLKRGKVRIHLLRMLGDCRQWMTTREVEAACRGLARKETIAECLMDLVAQQQVETKAGPRGSKIYRVSVPSPVPRPPIGDPGDGFLSVPRPPPFIRGGRGGQEGDWKDPDDGNDT